MSLEKQIEANTLAIRELTTVIRESWDQQKSRLARSETTSQPLYDTVLSEFTALQSLDEKAATALVIGLGVRSISEVSASRYQEVLEHIAKFRSEVVKKLAASQESTTAPTAETSSQEPGSAQDATTGGDDGKKLEPSVRFAETTNISADGANTTTDTATAKNSTEDKLDIYQEAADAILADKPVFTEYQQVADEFLKLVKDKGREAAIELLSAYGVKTAKELKPEQYQAFGEDVLRILGDSLV
jgi:hypothetical protein